MPEGKRVGERRPGGLLVPKDRNKKERNAQPRKERKGGEV